MGNKIIKYGQFRIEIRELTLEERLVVADNFNSLIREDCLTKVSLPLQTPELKLVEQHRWLDSLGPNVVPERHLININHNKEQFQIRV
jgi:hypothetical protein